MAAVASMPSIRMSMANPTGTVRTKLAPMPKHLALCHSVIIDPASGKYNAQSPDELALVDGAAAVGYIFKSRDADLNIEIEVPGG